MSYYITRARATESDGVSSLFHVPNNFLVVIYNFDVYPSITQDIGLHNSM